MGIKRSLDAEEFSEPSIRVSKRLDYNKKLNLNIDESHINATKADFPGGAEGVFCELHYDEPLENNEPDATYTADKQHEPSAPLSLATGSSSDEEDSGDAPASFWPYFSENDFSMPRRTIEHSPNPYGTLLYGAPRKEVLVGPDYQAEIPMWDPHTSRGEREQELMGTRIIPDDSNVDGLGLDAGFGWADCICLDMGSVRCVEQHVKEEREKLLDFFGPENFAKLGFDEMGDEVARRWARDEERAFHEIVMSNPVGFWKHLRAEFVGRTTGQIVSYYFNVFMLRRRAAQNRSFVLDIDSDDEGQGSHDSVYPGNNDKGLGQNGECYFVCGPGGEGGDVFDDEGDEGPIVESFSDEDFDASWMNEFWAEPGKVDVDSKVGRQENGGGDVSVEKKDGPF